MVRHPRTGKYRRARLFVLTLGYSRKAVRLLVWQSSAQTWTDAASAMWVPLGVESRPARSGLAQQTNTIAAGASGHPDWC